MHEQGRTCDRQIFVNFGTVVWKMMKMKCIGTVQYPSLLIENEKPMIGQVHLF